MKLAMGIQASWIEPPLRLTVLGSFLAAGLLISGCSESRSDMIVTSVSGTVLLDGTPLRDGQINLLEPSTRRGALGTLDEEGRFIFGCIPAGDYQVTILPPGLPHPGEPEPVRPVSRGPLREIPKKYRTWNDGGPTIKLSSAKQAGVVVELQSK